MTTNTETITVICPNTAKPIHGGGAGDPEWDGEGLCEGENEVEVLFEWDPGQKASWGDAGGDPPIPAGIISVTCPPITCEWCGYHFSENDRQKIETDFQPTERD